MGTNFTRYKGVGDGRPDLSRFTVARFIDIDDYVVTTLRIDERTVPTALLKKFCAKEEQRVRIEQQIPRLSRGMRMEIKERIRTEMIRRAKPTTVTVDVVWNVATGTVLFFSTSGKHRAIFEDFFKESTGLIINSVVTEPQPDFLTWLWWKSETGDDVQIGKRLVLEDNAGGKVTCTGPEELPEAMTALATGKKLVQAGMQISDFSLTYTSLDEFKSVKLPRTGGTEQSDRDGATLERVYLIEQLIAAIDGYRNTFMIRRADPGLWAIESGRINAWISEHMGARA